MMSHRKKRYQTRWWQLRYFLLNFHLETWGFMIQFDEHIFSDGLVKNRQLAKLAVFFLGVLNPPLGEKTNVTL